MASSVPPTNINDLMTEIEKQVCDIQTFATRELAYIQVNLPAHCSRDGGPTHLISDMRFSLDKQFQHLKGNLSKVSKEAKFLIPCSLATVSKPVITCPARE